MYFLVDKESIRAFLREDPDIMLVGEIRDKETALEALRASQTGHLVFSTIHVNNTIETVQRLLDFDLLAGSIAAEMLAILSQGSQSDAANTVRPSICRVRI